jgi:hypothetical protein
MNTALIEKNILVKDADGNWYAIPPKMEQEFIRIKEECISTDFGSNEWQNANDELNSVFSPYRKD